jgi:hypothetical protein
MDYIIKRARLESVVPAPAPSPSKQVAQQPPATPKSVAPPLLLSGHLMPAEAAGAVGVAATTTGREVAADAAREAAATAAAGINARRKLPTRMI